MGDRAELEAEQSQHLGWFTHSAHGLKHITLSSATLFLVNGQVKWPSPVVNIIVKYYLKSCGQGPLGLLFFKGFIIYVHVCLCVGVCARASAHGG